MNHLGYYTPYTSPDIIPKPPYSPSTLQECCDRHKKGMWPDKFDVHSYLETYEKYLTPYRFKAKNILEIGLTSGASLKMWTEYFRGDVYGIDCELKPIGGQEDLTEVIAQGYKVVIGDATNPADLEKHFKGIQFDVIIEDAQHNIEQQLTIYETLKPYMAKDGIYICEDVQAIDETRILFEAIDPERTIEIIDLRAQRGRYDDVLVIIR